MTTIQPKVVNYLLAYHKSLVSASALDEKWWTEIRVKIQNIALTSGWLVPMNNIKEAFELN